MGSVRIDTGEDDFPVRVTAALSLLSGVSYGSHQEIGRYGKEQVHYCKHCGVVVAMMVNKGDDETGELMGDRQGFLYDHKDDCIIRLASQVLRCAFAGKFDLRPKEGGQ